MRNDHILTAEHVGRTQQHRIAQLVRDLDRFLRRHDREALRTRDAALLQQLVKALSVLCRINIICGRAEDIHAGICQMACELDRRLTAELHDNAVGLFGLDDVVHILRRQRVEIQAVAGVEVGGDGLRVVVADDRLVAELFQRPDTVYRAVVKLDALPDADGSRNRIR